MKAKLIRDALEGEQGGLQLRVFSDFAAMTMRAAVRRLAETVTRDVVDDIHACSLVPQTGVSLKYMMDFGSYPSAPRYKKNLLMSSQFLHKELPVRLAHRVTELENLPYGLSSKSGVLKVSILIFKQLGS